jgi:hypothetical protein
MRKETEMDERLGDDPVMDLLNTLLTDSDDDARRPSARRKSVPEYVAEITGCWHRSTKEIFRCSSLCAEAYKRLNKSDGKELLKGLPFGASTFSKLVKIGNNDRLRRYIKDLPPSLSTIYLLTSLSYAQLKQGIDTGIINPDARRRDIEFWRNSLRKPEAKEGPKTSGKKSPGPDRSRGSEATSRRPPTKTAKDEPGAQESDDDFSGLDELLEGGDDRDLDDLDDDESIEQQGVITFEDLKHGWTKKNGGLRPANWDKASTEDRARFVFEELFHLTPETGPAQLQKLLRRWLRGRA